MILLTKIRSFYNSYDLLCPLGVRITEVLSLKKKTCIVQVIQLFLPQIQICISHNRPTFDLKYQLHVSIRHSENKYVT